MSEVGAGLQLWCGGISWGRRKVPALVPQITLKLKTSL